MELRPTFNVNVEITVSSCNRTIVELRLVKVEVQAVTFDFRCNRTIVELRPFLLIPEDTFFDLL